MHEICNLLGSWEALVLEFEWVVVESLVVFEVVFLSAKEFIDFVEPGAVK